MLRQHGVTRRRPTLLTVYDDSERWYCFGCGLAIDLWATESHGMDGLLETSITLNRIGSEVLHHGIGLSREAEEIVEVRPGLLRMASGRVQCGMANVMLAIKVMGGNDTEAWRRALAIVTLA